MAQRKTALQKKIGEKRRLEEKKKNPYKDYVSKFELAKKKGWVFKEGADVLFSEEEFRAATAMYALKLENVEGDYKVDILEEQLSVNNDSIAQAVYLWNNKHPNLVEQYGRMTPMAFRNNERLNFDILKAQYGSSKEYDEAMSY